MLKIPISPKNLERKDEIERWVASLGYPPNLFSPRIAPRSGSMFDVLAKALDEKNADFSSTRVLSILADACAEAIAKRRELATSIRPDVVAAATLAQQSVSLSSLAKRWLTRRGRKLHRASANIDGHRGGWLAFIPAWVDFCAIADDPGVIDQAEGPAWDLWVDWIDAKPAAVEQPPLLLNWIPAPYVARFELAREVSTLDAIQWVEAA